MIIQETVEVTVNNNKIKFYKENGFPNCKRYDKIVIPVGWLGPTSKIKILCECDYCHKRYYKPYGEIIVGRKIIEKDCCYDCKHKKVEEINLIKYGVKTNLILEENKKKTEETNLKKYGVKNVMQNKKIHERQKQSLFKNYGVMHPMQSPEIREKTRQTMINKYGYEYCLNGLFLINGVYCSKAQKEICDYFHFNINCFIDEYCVDGLKDNIILEYNGGGHNLSVQSGKISEEDFLTREKTRLEKLQNKNYGIIIIENQNDSEITKEDYDYINNIIEEIKPSEIIYYQIKGSTTIENVSEQSSS